MLWHTNMLLLPLTLSVSLSLPALLSPSGYSTVYSLLTCNRKKATQFFRPVAHLPPIHPPTILTSACFTTLHLLLTHHPLSVIFHLSPLPHHHLAPLPPIPPLRKKGGHRGGYNIHIRHPLADFFVGLHPLHLRDWAKWARFILGGCMDGWCVCVWFLGLGKGFRVGGSAVHAMALLLACFSCVVLGLLGRGKGGGEERRWKVRKGPMGMCRSGRRKLESANLAGVYITESVHLLQDTLPKVSSRLPRYSE